MSALPSLSVVVVNWNNEDYLAQCLASLRGERADGVDVVVVDNGSSDGSRTLVRDRFPDVRLLEAGTNLGCCGGRNLGIAETQGEVVFLLDEDAAVAPGCLRTIRACFADDEALGALGCTVLDVREPQRVLEAGMAIDRFGFPVPLLEDDRSALFYCSGCALALRRSALGQVGWFDERLFIFMEEVDLCWRLRLAGYRVDIAGEARVMHESGTHYKGGTNRSTSPIGYRTSDRRVYLRERNTLAMLLVNYGRGSLLRRLPLHLVLMLIEATSCSVSGRWAFGHAYLRAIAWNVANLRGTLRRRSRVQRLRRVSDRQLPFDRRLGKWLAYRRVGVPRSAS